MKFSAASGIAIAPILFVIALLAILATAIASATSSFSGGTDQEKARVNASSIIDYASTVAAAVQRLQARGCSDVQISFERSGGVAANSNAPSDKHCHLYDIAGAGLIANPLPSEWFDSTRFVDNGGLWITTVKYYPTFNGCEAYQGYGTTTATDSAVDLTFEVGMINLDICTAINKLLNVNTPTFAPLDGSAWQCTGFNGAYTYHSTVTHPMPACIWDNYFNGYIFKSILIAR